MDRLRSNEQRNAKRAASSDTPSRGANTAETFTGATMNSAGDVEGTKELVEGALEEMGYEVVDNGIIELPSSKPAVFEFSGDTSLRPERFEEELEEHDFGMMRPTSNERDDGAFYCYVDVVTDHYKRVTVKIWNDAVRIYPKEQAPDKFELARIVHAIEDAFGGELTHAPVEREAEK